MRSTHCPIYLKKFIWGTAFCLSSPSLFAGPTSLLVNVEGDNNVSTAGYYQTGMLPFSGDLRGILNYINQNPDTYDVTFALMAGSETIDLNAMLPILNLNNANTITLDGTNSMGSGTAITIDGGSNFPGFFAELGTIGIQNFTIQNVLSAGGTGSYGGGGGMGAGAGLFIDQANVTISTLTISNAAANGGGTGGGPGGGGGGMFNGRGNSNVSGNGGGGGGGIGGAGGSGNGGGGGGGGINTGTNYTGSGGTAGAGSPGGGLGAAGAGSSFDVASGGATGGGGGGDSGTGGGGGGGIGGSSATNCSGALGGFGGGGGGGFYVPLLCTGNGGLGGFGGGGGGGGVGSSTGAGGGGGFGGGGGSAVDNAGTGGFGGGGGSSNTGPGGNGGVGGGIGNNFETGGGGAGFGGGIFVNSTGTLTIAGPFSTGVNAEANSVTGGQGGMGGNNGCAAGGDAFFLTNSSITLDAQGSTITINNSIADDSAGSVPSGMGFTPGTGSGAVLTVQDSSGMTSGVIGLLSSNIFSGGVTVNTGTFTLAVGQDTSLGSGTLTINSTAVNPTLQAAANSINVGNAVSLSSNTNVDSNGYTFELTGQISGSTNLINVGLGTLILSGSNTGYSGQTYIDNGTLGVGNSNALGTGGVTFNDNTNPTTLQCEGGNQSISNAVTMTEDGIFDSNSNTFTIGGMISGSGSITIDDSSGSQGTTIFSGSNNFTGDVTIIAGTLGVGNSSALSSSGVNVIFNNNMGSGTPTLQAEGTYSISNPIALTTEGIFDPNGNTFTIAGSISGMGSLSIADSMGGTGTTVLSNSNNYSGGTSVNSGTLQIAASDSLQGNLYINAGQTVLVTSSGGSLTIGDLTGGAAAIMNYGTNAFTFGTGNSVEYDGNIMGTGLLTKEGSGDANMTGTLSNSGGIEVAAGILSINGLVTSSTITVDANGMLEGTGTTQDVILNGIIEPGNSIGTINTGAFTFNSGSTYFLEFNNSESDLINASGVVTINSGSEVKLEGLAVTDPLSIYPIIISTMPLDIVGDFTLINPFPRFNFSLQYTATGVNLILGSISDFIATGNAGAAAVCFNTLINNPAPDLTEVILVLDGQTLAGWQDSFNQMQPANFNDIAFAQENVAERIRQIFSAHLFEQRVESCPNTKPWRVWVSPFVEHAHQRGHGDLKGYKDNFAGFTAAADYQFQKHWAVTGGFSYASSDVNIVHGRAKGDFNTYAGSLGAIWTDNRFFADGLFSYLFSDVHAQRKMHFTAPTASSVSRTARHKLDSNQVMGHLGGGYDFKVKAGKEGTMNIYPFIDVDYIYVIQDGYKENGAQSLNLRVKKKEYDLLRPEVGIGFGYAGCYKEANITADFSASYVREQRFLGKNTKSSFQDSSCQFTVSGLKPDNNLFSPTARISLIRKGSGFSLTFGYHGEFGAHFIENAGDAEFKYAF